MATKLWLAIGQLPEAYREAVLLHYVEGLDYSQISQITGISAGALRVRALRGAACYAGNWGRSSTPGCGRGRKSALICNIFRVRRLSCMSSATGLEMIHRVR